jgi:aryl-alcohol dehydrogenase-like predicted oxidoreductase
MKWNKIGFGTWPLSGDKNGTVSYGKVNEIDSEESLVTAYQNGINVYDTSNFYGFGYVESLIGNVFKDVRNKIVIITKGGFVDKDNQNFNPDYLKNALLQSLLRLRTDYVDVYMLHSPPWDVIFNSEVFWFLKSLKKEGIAKEIGISLSNMNHGTAAIANFQPDVLEVNYNILDRRVENNGIFEECREKNIKTVIRTPLGQGLLSGKFEFNGDTADLRQQWKEDKVKKQIEIYKKMLSVLNENNYTDAQNCLRFCLSNPNVSVIIPGMKTKNEVLENVKSLDFPLLTEQEQEKIKEIYKLHYDS